jgi:hypothetical protein
MVVNLEQTLVEVKVFWLDNKLIVELELTKARAAGFLKVER